ncbi:hypothetical protein F4803DRAFT_528685 [Xylaria telfairii]|nr:hypothetical protein F4803DRAFT_528685 [Xylaria telfairii]
MTTLNNIMQPTVEMPVMPAEIGRLVAMLDKGDSMAAIFKEMVANGMVECIEDKKWFGEYSGPMSQLFLSMSRPLLRCVLTKTLGPSLYCKDIFCKKNWDNVFDIDGPGAYAMFSFIRDRKGKWLCVKEIRELVLLVRDYEAAVDTCIRRRTDDVYGSSQLTREERRVLARAMEIDDAERTNKQRLTLDDLDRFKPRFESQSTGSGFIAQLIAMLERRCLPNVDPEVHQCQSPLMVGNAGNMKKRTVDHFPNNSLSKTPKTWGLLLSCMSVMGLRYEVQAVPLFRAWVDAKQVNAAEVLGTVLAGSLVSVSGMNVKQPGTRYEEARVDTYGYLNSQKHVWVGKPWFGENLKASILDSERNRKSQKEIDEANAELDRLEADTRRLEEEEEVLKKEVQEAEEHLKRVLAELEEDIAKREAFMAETERDARVAVEFLAACESAGMNVGYMSDSESQSAEDGNKGENEGEDD